MTDTISITPLTLPYGGKSSSAELNKFINEVSRGIIVLQNTADNLKRELTITTESLSAENHILSLRIAEIQNNEPGIASVSVSYFDPLADGTSAALINTAAGYITLPALNSISKTYFDVGGKIVLPKTLSIDIDPPANQNDIIDHGLMDALTPDIAKFWARRISTPLNSPSVAEAVATVILPEDIISNRNCNVIDITPFPLGGVDIVSVDYSSSGVWQSLPGFSIIRNAGKTRLTFPVSEIAAVRIRLRQRHSQIQSDKQIFHLGIRSISVSFIESKPNANFTALYEFPDNHQRTITGSIPYFINEEALSDISTHKKTICTYDLYSVDEFGFQTLLTNLPTTVTSNKILIKGTLSRDKTGIAPLLERIEISYNQ